MLAQMHGKESSYSLVIGMQTGTTTMKMSVLAPEEAGNISYHMIQLHHSAGEFYVNSTEARVILEERTSVEKMSLQDWPVVIL